MQELVSIHRLSNGIRVAFLPTLSQVSHLGVMVLGGSRYEQKDEVGLAHFLEHCIFKGTKSRRAYHVLSRIDSVGGELNAYTTKEEICVYASFLNNYFDRSAELLSDIIQNSTFPEKEIEKEKEVVLDEINSYLDAPSDRIMDDFERYFFQNHPLGENILGIEDSVRSFSKKHLESYLHRHFTTEKIVISVVGGINQVKALKVLEKYFSSISKETTAASPVYFEKYQPFKVIERNSNYQSHVVMGGLAPGFDRVNDRRALNLLINILGGPALNSRLTLNIREKHGYSYTIEANNNSYQDVGYWNIYFSCNESYVKKTIKQVYNELKRIREVELTPKQLLQAKEQFKGYLALGVESNSGRMLEMAKSILIFDEIKSLNEVYQAIDEITSAELLAVANRYFQEDQISELVYLPMED